jgi:hypothetical protein
MELFRSGESFDFRDVQFSVGADGVVSCSIESSWHKENVTPATANRDLDEGEMVFRHLLEESQEFREAVGTRPVSFDLVEWAGMGSILLCSRRDGILAWESGLPPGAS